METVMHIIIEPNFIAIGIGIGVGIRVGHVTTPRDLHKFGYSSTYLQTSCNQLAGG